MSGSRSDHAVFEETLAVDRLHLAQGAARGLREEAAGEAGERGRYGTAESAQIKPRAGFRRLTKMPANLAAWLAPCRESVGLLAPANACKKLSAFAKAKGFRRTPDVMRHSFIS